MNRIEKITTEDPKKFYDYLNLNLKGLIAEEKDWLANLANASGLLYLLMDNINWAGFYLYKEEELILGPFQGKPACTRIEIGSGVCGTAANTFETQVVEDVNAFPGHIACDPDSQSEIVVPMIREGKLIGVLDIDSPIKNRFNEIDREYLEKFVEIILNHREIPLSY
ncbi:GAF domain-containing protein [Isachenkonia alkalipeptolytica]|uniref:GAF domain-containing protein n=1 Tax=Isachenkonia alkalipeptolytica TaxID=2565777 RepID=A0AA43XJW0_9CLOT|nr:GAF domain-containing protein [Isachenkonia alkalipeptolytica]NBG87982.1 GAF domain-containing protein [Isachenkonia alkalipeptolytica]